MKENKNNSLEDGHYLKKVLPHFITDNVFTPSEPPKPTNIGVVLTKYLHPSDDSYGTHPSKYGGIGYEKIDHPDFTFAPRKSNHLRTGVDWEIMESSSPHQRQVSVESNKAFFAQPIGELGNEIFKEHMECKNKQTVASRVRRDNVIFPKSSVYDFENIRAGYFNKLKKKQKIMEQADKSIQVPQIMSDTYDKNLTCTPGSLLKLDCTEFEKTFHKDRHTPQPWWPAPPFWYNPNKSGDKSISPRNLSDYSANVPNYSNEAQHSWLDEMQLRNSQNYIPGEIYKNTIPKPLVEDLTKSGSCTKEWKPRNENYSSQDYYIENIPDQKPLETEVDNRRKMSYSESLGLEEPEEPKPETFRTPCLFRNRMKTLNICGCGACKCILNTELGLLLPDERNKLFVCGCIKCHVSRYNEIKRSFKKYCECI